MTCNQNNQDFLRRLTPRNSANASESCGLEVKRKSRGWLTEEERVSERRGGNNNKGGGREGSVLESTG